MQTESTLRRVCGCRKGLAFCQFTKRESRRFELCKEESGISRFWLVFY